MLADIKAIGKPREGRIQDLLRLQKRARIVKSTVMEATQNDA